MSESNQSAKEKHLSYEHYRLCFWIGFLTLGPLIMLSIGISSHPLGIIDHVIRFIVFFGLGGTAGGLATLFVGYPLELVCFNLSYGREQRRWFLAFAVPFVTVATYIALFTHRDSLFEPAANLLTLALPLSLTYCGIIFAFDKIITKISKLQILHKQKHLE